MANKTIPALPDYGSQDSDKIRKDLLEITKNDGTYASPTYGTGATRKITVEDLKTALAITSQTVTNGVTTKSPSEDAVFDAIYAKGLVKSNAWKNNGVGTFTLEADKYNIVNYSNTNIEILLPAVEVDKTIIVQGTTQDGSGSVNFTINNIKIGGADLGTPYSVTVTNEKEVLLFYGNYYGWHLIGHSNKTIDLSTKLDLDGGNANQDIDIGANKFTSETLEVNKASGSGVAVNVVKGGAGEALTVTKTSGSGNVASFNGGTTLVETLAVSSATVNTIAHFDATKNIESLPLATYPNLTELSYVKGVTSAIQTQLNNGIEFAYESWSTDANYTITNTTAKYLFVDLRIALSVSRTITLSVLPAGSTLVIRGNVSITGASVIHISGFVNGVSSYANAVSNAYGDIVLYSIGGGSYTTTPPEFVETPTTLTTTKRLIANTINAGYATAYTGIAGGQGDIKPISFNSTNGLLVNSSNGAKIYHPVDGTQGWSQEIPTTGTFLKYWDGAEIGAGGVYPQPSGASKNTYYAGYHFFRVANSTCCIEGYFYNAGTVNSLIITKPTQNAVSLQVALVSNKIQVTTNEGLNVAYIQLLNTWTSTDLPSLNQFYSSGGTTNYWTGSGGFGIGHTSQNASAILQADSTTKGFLPPRMTNTQRTNIVSPAVGLMVYCTDTIEGLYIYKSTGWTFII